VRKFSLRTLRRVVLLLLFALFTAIVWRWISLERLRLTLLRPIPPIQLSPTPAPAWPEVTPTPTKPPVISGKIDTARLFNGITLHADVATAPGAAAADERNDPQSYVLDLKLNVRLPAPNKTIDELAKVSPQLPKLLPGLAAMLTPNAVAPFFNELYEAKIKLLRENLLRLDQLLSRHNFFDCQTALQLQNPQTKRKAVLLQADMDVDADGSDADRLPTTGLVSPTTKPFTSYRWPKKTPTPNPYLAIAEEKLHKYEAEFATKGLPAERNRDLKAAIQQLKSEIDSLKRFSFLIGATDPYIVLPGGFLHGADAGKMGKVGDYAVVVFGEGIYPAIVGDVGPQDKVGEASLRIAKEINPASGANNRPVSDLKVSYIIFPGTAETPFGPPDLEKMRTRCEALVNEIGGAGVPLHHWQDIIPTPTPTPSPTPTVTPTPPPSASPSSTFAFPIVSPSPSVSVTPASIPPIDSQLSPAPSSSLVPTTSPLVRPSP
jgi:hypothetical protein